MDSLHLVPSFYFFKTRFNSKKELIFHSTYEWILAVLVLFFLGPYDALSAVKYFLVGFYIFISIYELGYFFNDYYSVRFDVAPNKRIATEGVSWFFIGTFVGLRLALFAVLIYTFKIASISLFVFYALLVLVFALHNFLKNPDYKFLTFINLSFFRFFAPVVFFLSPEKIALLVPPMLLFYMVYRSLNYLDSKKLLFMKSRQELTFKINYYLLLIPLSIIIAYVQQSYVTLWLNAYFLIFWIGLYAAEKIKNKLGAKS